MDRFNIIETELNSVYIIEPTIHKDDRGYFVKTYDDEEFKAKGLDFNFVQDDQSCSSKGVLRGLHFQKKHPQSKLIRVVRGKVFDVGVDLRKNSETYGKWIGVELSDENKKQLFLPKGFAHGFLALEDNTIFVYKVDELYYPNDEGGLAYDDEDIAIEWPFDEVDDIIISDKDKNWGSLKEFDFVFDL